MLPGLAAIGQAMEPCRFSIVTGRAGVHNQGENDMKLLKLAAIAAVAATSLSLPAAPAFARHNDWHHGRGHQSCQWVGHGRHRHRVCRWVR
jgi:hypothetical protein